MTAPITASPSVSDLESGPRLSTRQTHRLRSLLLVEGEALAVTLARWEEALVVGGSPAHDAGLDRAMAALRMYAAREALEEIQAALACIDTGEYGICRGCGLPISFEHLQAIPQARLCAACPRSATPSAGRGTGPCLGAPRGEHTGAPHGVLAEASTPGQQPHIGEPTWQPTGTVKAATTPQPTGPKWAASGR